MSELDYATVAKLGGIIKTVRISHRLELYPDIKGSPGKWSDITFTADRKWMSDMPGPVIEDVGTAPCQGEVEWVAIWKQGRKKQRGEGHYRDLVALRQA